MSNDTQVTVVGNLTADPELRFTPSGAAVANFTVATTPRSFDKTRNEWVDGEAMFLGCAVWRDAAQNVAETLTKGMRIIVQGRLRARSYDDKAGVQRTVFEIDVDEVGPSLRYASASVAKNAKTTTTRAGQQPATSSRPAQQAWAAPTSTDQPPF